MNNSQSLQQRARDSLREAAALLSDADAPSLPKSSLPKSPLPESPSPFASRGEQTTTTTTTTTTTITTPSPTKSHGWQSDELQKPLFLWHLEQFASRIAEQSRPLLLFDLGSQSSGHIFLLKHLLRMGTCPANILGAFSRSTSLAEAAALEVPDSRVSSCTTAALGPGEMIAVMPEAPAIIGIVAAFTINVSSPKFTSVLSTWAGVLSPECEVFLAIRSPPPTLQNILCRGRQFAVISVTIHHEPIDSNHEVAFVTLRRIDQTFDESSLLQQNQSITKHMERMSRAIERRAVEKELENITTHSRFSQSAFITHMTPKAVQASQHHFGAARRKVRLEPRQDTIDPSLFGGSRRKIDQNPKMASDDIALFGGSRRKAGLPFKQQIEEVVNSREASSSDIFGFARRPSGRKAHETTVMDSRDY